MNAGFSNLDFLKKQLLAQTLANDLRFDAVIAALGLGVAGQFATFCNRRFQRAEEVEILPADKCQFLLGRYPVETLTAIDLKKTEGEGWLPQVVNVFMNTLDTKAGIVNCPDGVDAGPWYAQVRFTYTGGYWWNTSEPDEAEYSLSAPAGANYVPAELLLAWVLQCKHIWAGFDKVGTDILKKVKPESGAAEFAPSVEKTLGQFTRYNLV